jgi:hypothetical protein
MRLNCGEEWFDTLNRYNAKQWRCRKPMVTQAHFLAASLALEQPELDLQILVDMCEAIDSAEN